MVAIRDGASTPLYNRNGRDITRGHRHLVEELESLKQTRFVLDGELVALDDDGRSNFSRLMNGRTGTHFAEETSPARTPTNKGANASKRPPFYHSAARASICSRNFAQLGIAITRQ
jgi:hypothetical protein